MKNIKYADKLLKGDIIGVTAVSSCSNLEKIDDAVANIEKRGYKIIETSNTRKIDEINPFVSSSAINRANEFLELYKDEKVKHIIAASGGEFLIDILPYIHNEKEELLEIKPKYVQGMSDVSLLLYYLTTNLYIATLHSVNVGTYCMKNWHKSLQDSFRILESEENSIKQTQFEKYQMGYDMKKENEKYVSFNLDYDVEYKVIGENKNINFEGRILGGCIDVITQLIGTKMDNTAEFIENFKDDGIIWYLDNCELTSLEFYRRIVQMENAGWFKYVKGFLIGRTNGVSVEDLTFENVYKQTLEKYNVPIIYDIDVGHLPPQINFINGSYAKCEFINKKFDIEQIKK